MLALWVFICNTGHQEKSGVGLQTKTTN